MKKLAAGIFRPQIHALELQRKIGRRRRDVQSDHIEPGQLRQQTSSQISGNSRHYYSWFCIAHLFGTGFRGLHCGFGRFDRRRPAAGASEKYFSFNCGRRRRLNTLQRLLHALRAQRGKYFVLHLVQRERVFFANLVDQISVRSGNQL